MERRASRRRVRTTSTRVTSADCRASALISPVWQRPPQRCRQAFATEPPAVGRANASGYPTQPARVGSVAIRGVCWSADVDVTFNGAYDDVARGSVAEDLEREGRASCRRLAALQRAAHERERCRLRRRTSPAGAVARITARNGRRPRLGKARPSGDRRCSDEEHKQCRKRFGWLGLHVVQKITFAPRSSARQRRFRPPVATTCQIILAYVSLGVYMVGLMPSARSASAAWETSFSGSLVTRARWQTSA